MSDKKPSFNDLIRDKNFSLMWIAMLISTFGTFSLLLVLSTEIYRTTKSAFMSGSVFAAQWVIPLLFAFGIAKLLRSPRIFSILSVSELVGAVTSIVAGFALSIENLTILFTALIIRGLVESVTKSGRILALKTYTRIENLELASSMFNSSYYLGIAGGTMLAPLLAEHFSVLQIGILDGITFLLSALIYRALSASSKSLSSQTVTNVPRSSFQLLRSLVAKKQLLLTSALAILNVGLFQGYHNIARTALPMGHFQSNAGGVALLQSVNIGGIMAGLFFVGSVLVSKRKDRLNSPILWFFAAGLLLLIPLLVDTFSMALAFYFLFAFCFEVAFVLLQNKIILDSDREELSILTLINQSAMSGGMALCVIIIGTTVDAYGLLLATFSLTLFSTMLTACYYFFANAIRKGEKETDFLKGGSENAAI